MQVERPVPGRDLGVRRGPATSDRLLLLNEVARIATEDLELQPMLQRITDALHRRFGWEFVAIATVDEAAGEFTCEAVSTALPTSVSRGYRRSLGSGVVGEVAATGRAILLDDVSTHDNYVETLPGAMSELCVPVRHQGRLLAVLNLESLRPAAFHDELTLLSTVAEQVAGAIAGARALQAAERRADLLQLLSDVSRAAVQPGRLGEVLNRIARFVHARFPRAWVSISLLDETGRWLKVEAWASRRKPPAPLGTRWPVSKGVCGRAVRTRQPQHVLDPAGDPDWVVFGGRAACEYAVPLQVGDEVLGVMDVETAQRDAFSEGDREVLRTLADQVAGAVRLAVAHDRLRVANRALQRLSMSDPLTRLPNRRRFEQVLEAEWRRAARTGTPLSVLVADLDSFKAFNDAHGHPAGDTCLRQVATALRAGLRRAGDFVARWGGEEFVAVLPGTPASDARRIAESLRRAIFDLAVPHGASPVSPVVTVTIGAAGGIPRAEDTAPTDLLLAADSALYEAKALGRNRVALSRRAPRRPRIAAPAPARLSVPVSRRPASPTNT